jgi:hypothetical protein
VKEGESKDMRVGRPVEPVDTTPGQSHYILNKLIAAKTVTRKQISQIMTDMRGEIEDIERKLQELRGIDGDGFSGAIAKVKRVVHSAPRVSIKKRTIRMTPEREASMKEQGRYMSLLHQLPASKRERIKKLAKKQGRAAAINTMLGMV